MTYIYMAALRSLISSLYVSFCWYAYSNKGLTIHVVINMHFLWLLQNCFKIASCLINFPTDGWYMVAPFYVRYLKRQPRNCELVTAYMTYPCVLYWWRSVFGFRLMVRTLNFLGWNSIFHIFSQISSLSISVWSPQPSVDIWCSSDVYYSGIGK